MGNQFLGFILTWKVEHIHIGNRWDLVGGRHVWKVNYNIFQFGPEEGLDFGPGEAGTSGFGHKNQISENKNKI